MSTKDELNDSIDGLLKYPVKNKYSTQVCVHMHPKVVNKTKQEIKQMDYDLKTSDPVEQDQGEKVTLPNHRENEDTKEKTIPEQNGQNRGRNVLKSEYPDDIDNLNSCGLHLITENPQQLESRNRNLSVVDAKNKEFHQAILVENNRRIKSSECDQLIIDIKSDDRAPSKQTN
ncbi:unnamed protein product [Schistosoma intercalatum]|nr:unnamed protein product [Schistosoma intercalatum]